MQMETGKLSLMPVGIGALGAVTSPPNPQTGEGLQQRAVVEKAELLHSFLQPAGLWSGLVTSTFILFMNLFIYGTPFSCFMRSTASIKGKSVIPGCTSRLKVLAKHANTRVAQPCTVGEEVSSGCIKELTWTFFMGKMLLPDTLLPEWQCTFTCTNEGVVELFQVSFMFCPAEYCLLQKEIAF